MANELSKIDNFTSENIQKSLNELLVKTDQKPIVLFSIIRISTTWSAFSPDLAPSLELLKKDTTLRRLLSAKTILEQNN